LFLVLGLLVLVFHGAAGRAGARFQRGAAKDFPWLYRWPLGRAFLSEQVWAVLAVLIGVMLIVGGVAILVGD
jgi:hypothetical protein